ncbi:response regulator transcription factor [Saccharopolyspora sp. ASAGF58]|uniref:response regulator transcription factor n=1 Tax=Saccharopolyspora sp. ASAGF58 TaxID=2719023 RepID=UPI001440275C|nr:response regulator transcription factor [Saccharopolyspora sp. ASAGF58]QIZ33662.1 response regulator transcription factor [Saccharopolyspora sp. ASAGF58]
MRVLVVEDERMMADAVGEGLRDSGLAVDVVYDGAAALERCVSTSYDVVVLDRGLPLVHGDEVCRSLIAERRETRILLLTAASGVADRVAGLELGADDYLPKPFAFTELVARVRSLGRRSRPAVPPVLQRAGIALDPARHRVTRHERPVSLTKKEFIVLEELLRADGAVVSAEELLETAWDENIDPFTNVVRVTMATLRRKLGDPSPVETVSGVGYRIP